MKKQDVWALCLAGMACLVSCSNEGEGLLSGRTNLPMELTTVVEPVSLTRASADNVWTGDGTERVSISDGSKAATYTIVDAVGGLAPTVENEQLYWASGTEPQEITAWYPATAGNAQLESWNIQSDQSGTGYQQSDLLMGTASVALQGNRVLPLQHQTAKMIIHLQGDGTTDADLEGATLKINNVVLEGIVSGGSLKVKEGIAPSTVIPRQRDEALINYIASFEALLIPQLVADKVLIEVSTQSGKSYKYTPTGNDGLLEGTAQNIYYVIVGKPGISVQVKKEGTQWGSDGDQIVDAN